LGICPKKRDRSHALRGNAYWTLFVLYVVCLRNERKTGIKPMSKTNVGANLMFARRTKTGIKPMFDNEFETIASDIGSQTLVVRRANIRFAPTLVSDIGWISITTIYPKTYDRLLIKQYLSVKGENIENKPYDPGSR